MRLLGHMCAHACAARAFAWSLHELCVRGRRVPGLSPKWPSTCDNKRTHSIVVRIVTGMHYKQAVGASVAAC